MVLFFGNRTRGSVIIEASLTLPVIVMMILFTLEMMKINNAKISMGTIATEATLDFVAHRQSSRIDNIIAKYTPQYGDNVKYYFAVYESLEKMCSVTPFGNEEVYWPESDTSFPTNPKSYIESGDSTGFLARNTNAESGHITLTDYTKPENSLGEELAGKAFVFTVVCSYSFSSPFISSLFIGGSNTKGEDKRFLIFGRGVGICE